MAGLVGIAALGRLLSRRNAAPPVDEPASVADPAEELRQRLAAQRTTDAAPPKETADATGETLEERRARIHEKAQQAIDSMREPPA